MNARSKPAGPDPTQIMLQKNDRIKENYVRTMRRIGSEAERSTGDLEKQIKDLQQEIRDIHAYTIVYKDNSLIRIDERRSKPSYNNFLTNNSPQSLPTKSKTPTATVRMARVKPGSATTTRQYTDHFNVKGCLLDVERDLVETETQNHSKPPPLAADDEPKITVRKKLKRSSTAFTSRTGSTEYQSLLPRNCTSYYSIRKYYEIEKDKLLQKWSPQERRKQTVKWILDNLKLPQFSEIRRSTTSAIFRDFNSYKSGTDIPTVNKLTERKSQLSLPAISGSSETVGRET